MQRRLAIFIYINGSVFHIGKGTHLYASQHLSILMQNTVTQQYLKIFSNHVPHRGDHASSERPAEGFPDLFMILLKNMSKSSPSGLCI